MYLEPGTAELVAESAAEAVVAAAAVLVALPIIKREVS